MGFGGMTGRYPFDWCEINPVLVPFCVRFPVLWVFFRGVISVMCASFLVGALGQAQAPNAKDSGKGPETPSVGTPKLHAA